MCGIVMEDQKDDDEMTIRGIGSRTDVIRGAKGQLVLDASSLFSFSLHPSFRSNFQIRKSKQGLFQMPCFSSFNSAVFFPTLMWCEGKKFFRCNIRLEDDPPETIDIIKRRNEDIPSHDDNLWSKYIYTKRSINSSQDSASSSRFSSWRPFTPCTPA